MSCIIFLKDIQIDDYRDIEDEFNDRLLQNLEDQDNYKIDSLKYDIIPPYFSIICLFGVGSILYILTL